MLALLAGALGVPEAALRLIASIFLCYPIAYGYRYYIHPSQPKVVCQLFLSAAGILLGVFNYGLLVYHSLIAVLASFLFIKLLPAESLLVPVTFAFHFTYLLVGYIATATDEYDITWTMPHCVLTLRLIGLSFDVADATIPVEKQSKDQKRLCIKEKPCLLEITTYTFFPCTYLVGPQFPLERLRRYLNHDFDQYTQNTKAGLIRLAQGLGFLLINQVLLMFVNDDTLLSEEYGQKPFLWRLILLGLWGKTVIWKYSSCWMMAEGSAIVSGISFVGIKPQSGEEDWSGCANMDLYKCETAHKFQNYVESFNMQTNFWVAHYVYKRLKFFNNKILSFVGTLFFLAVWHGFHSGYYMTFSMEFFTVSMEKEIDAAFDRNKEFQNFVASPIGSIISKVVCFFYTFVFAGWNLSSFVLLSFNKWWPLFGALNYIGLIFAPLAFVSGPVLRILLPRTIEKPTKKLE